MYNYYGVLQWNHIVKVYIHIQKVYFDKIWNIPTITLHKKLLIKFRNRLPSRYRSQLFYSSTKQEKPGKAHTDKQPFSHFWKQFRWLAMGITSNTAKSSIFYLSTCVSDNHSGNWKIKTFVLLYLSKLVYKKQTSSVLRTVIWNNAMPRLRSYHLGQSTVKAWHQ